MILGAHDGRWPSCLPPEDVEQDFCALKASLKGIDMTLGGAKERGEVRQGWLGGRLDL